MRCCTRLGSSAIRPGRLPLLALAPLLVLIMNNQATAQKIHATQADLIYATEGETPLRLDLYLPEADQKPAGLIVWIHGGAWRAGTKSQVPIKGILQHGLAIASVDYRLSTEAAFPAQLHDITRAIAFLRRNAGKFSIDPERIAIAGSSAGGHLAALAGVASNVTQLAGRSEDGRPLPAEALRISAIVSLYGASNLETILQQSTPHGLNVRIPALQLLLRAQPDENPALARLASPVTHVDSKDPPLLLIHGDQDIQMPINQSHELRGAYLSVGRKVEFDVIHGGGHGGEKFYTQDRLQRIATFINQSFTD